MTLKQSDENQGEVKAEGWGHQSAASREAERTKTAQSDCKNIFKHVFSSSQKREQNAPGV